MKRPAWTQDPAAPSITLFTGVIVAGFAAIGLGWRVAARTLFVPSQVPALISGGLAGLALVLIGAAFVTVQSDRRLAALERAETEDLLDEATALVAAVRSRNESRSAR
ncbi:MAG: hypothetical protein JWO88_2005 [Frankiales bacterium]|nr:hypothetical protein [Frankiales bacterium]